MSSTLFSTPYAVDLCVMCPQMDLAALSLHDAKTGDSHVYVYRTRGDASAATAAPDSVDGAPLFTYVIRRLSGANKKVSNDGGEDEDDDVNDDAGADAAADGANKIVSMQWGPAGGRLLAVATATEVYILHVELQALLRVHKLAGSSGADGAAWVLSPSPSSSQGDNPIVALAWDKVTPEQQLGGSAAASTASAPFPCFKLLSAAEGGDGGAASAAGTDAAGGGGASSDSSGAAAAAGGDPRAQAELAARRCSPRLVELAEAEWAAGGAASVLLVLFADGRISFLLGGLYEVAVMPGASGSAAASSKRFAFYVGPYTDKAKTGASTTHLVVCAQAPNSPVSTVTAAPLDAALRCGMVSVQRRVACQTREMLVKTACDLRELHRRWADGVDRVLDRAFPAVLWANRAAVAATLLTGAPLAQLLDRRELEQSAVVSAAESLRELAAATLRAVVDVLFECIAYATDNSSALAAGAPSASPLAQLPCAVAELRAALCDWVRQLAAQRDVLASVLRWLHSFIGSTRAAAAAIAAASHDPDDPNSGGSIAPPAVSSTDPTDFLVAFDFLTAEFALGLDDSSSSSSDATDSTKPRLPRGTAAALDKAFSSATAAAAEALRRIDASKRTVAAQWSPAASGHGNLVAGNGDGRALQWHYDDTCGAVAVSVAGARQMIIPVGGDEEEEAVEGGENNSGAEEIAGVVLDAGPGGASLDLYTITTADRGAVVAIRRTSMERDGAALNVDEPTLNQVFKTQFAAVAAGPAAAVRLFANSQRDVAAVVRGKKVQFLDVGEILDGSDDADDEDGDAAAAAGNDE